MSDNILTAALIAMVLMTALWFLRGIMLTPVRMGKNQRLTLLLRLDGEAPELENTVNSLRWLIDNGTINADIAVVGPISDPETSMQAEILEKKGLIKIIN